MTRFDVGIDGVFVRLEALDERAISDVAQVVCDDQANGPPLPYTLRAQHSERWVAPSPPLADSADAEQVQARAAIFLGNGLAVQGTMARPLPRSEFAADRRRST